MTPQEFQAARQALGFSRADLAVKLGDGDDVYSVRAVASWENGTNNVPPAVARLLKLMLRAGTRSSGE